MPQHRGNADQKTGPQEGSDDSGFHMESQCVPPVGVPNPCIDGALGPMSADSTFTPSAIPDSIRVLGPVGLSVPLRNMHATPSEGHRTPPTHFQILNFFTQEFDANPWSIYIVTIMRRLQGP